jgi:hypothetical protein
MKGDSTMLKWIMDKEPWDWIMPAFFGFVFLAALVEHWKVYLVAGLVLYALVKLVTYETE